MLPSWLHKCHQRSTLIKHTPWPNTTVFWFSRFGVGQAKWLILGIARFKTSEKSIPRVQFVFVKCVTPKKLLFTVIRHNLWIQYKCLCNSGIVGLGQYPCYRSVVLNQGQLFPQETFGNVEIFWIVLSGGRRCDTESGRQRPGRLLSGLQCRGQPPWQRIFWPKVAVMPRWRKPITE